MFQTQQVEDVERLRLALAQSEQVRKHYQSVPVSVTIPALQAAVTGLGVSGLAGVVWVYFGWPYPLLVVPGVFLLVFVLTWWGSIENWRKLVWTLENVLHADIDGDNIQGEPVEPETVPVQIKSEDGRRLEFGDIPTSRSKLEQLARGLSEGRKFTEREWAGSGKLFSQGEFDTLRDYLVGKGWARYKNKEHPNLGVELGVGGAAVMRTFAGESPTLSTRGTRK